MSESPQTTEVELEITPEMLEAGADELMGFSTFFEGHASWAERVYVAMRRVALERDLEEGAAHEP